MEECINHTCDYYTHYLAYETPGQPNLTHEGFHAAAMMCDKVQKELWDWWQQEENQNKDPLADPRGRYLWNRATQWEEKVRA
jgi:hypothetical protein